MAGLEDTELARRSMLGYGEMLASLGRSALGAEAELRRPDALGARLAPVADSPWFDAAVVPADAAPPADEPGLPQCLWTTAEEAPGRVEDPAIALPCLGIVLDRPSLEFDGPIEIAEPPLATLGAVNERAYGDNRWFAPLIAGLRDGRARTHGLREDGAFVCVALTLSLGDDLAINFVATEPAHRRRGLARKLARGVLAEARRRGMRSATLQASAAGLPMWRGLGFRPVATLRGHLRPAVWPGEETARPG